MRMQHETFVIRMKLNEMTGEVISDINVAIVALTYTYWELAHYIS